MDVQKKVGKVIRDLRIKNNLSQESFASRVGIHRTYIGMIERGEKNITVSTLSKIAKGLNVHAWQIIKKAGL